MKYKFNPLTWEFNLVPDSGTLKQKLNWLTGNFNLTKDASKYKQIYNVIEGEFNLRPATTQIVVHWVWSVQLTNAAKNWLLSLKAYGWTEQRSSLPSEYTQLEYTIIPSWWYLTTDFIPTYDCKVEFEFTITTLWTSWATTYLWVRPSTTWNGWLRCARISTKVFRIYGFGSYQDSTDTATANTRYKFTWDNQRWIVTTGSTTVFDKTYSDTWSNTYPLTINGWNSAGTVTPWAEDVYVHSFKAWDNQWVLAANYIPCVYNNEVGFYDTVSESFKWATAWTFTAWPNAVPTPTVPMDIVSNNWVLKFSKNMANVNTQTALVWYYISAQWVVTADANNRIYQDYIPCKPNTTYTLSLSSSVYFVSISEYSTTEDSGFIVRKAGSTGSNTQLTITTGANTNYLRFWTNIDRTEVTLEEVLAINWQLERWDTPTPYHEYVEWGVYADWITETIWVHGKNLFDENDVILGYFYNDSGTYISNNVTYTSGKIPMNAGTTVTFSRGLAVAGVYLRIHAFDSNDNWIGLVAKSSTATDLSCTGTTPANTSYIRVCGAKKAAPSTEIDHECQVELGSTATEYAPYYNGDTATAEMLLKVSNYVDEQEILSWNITRKVGVQVFDGTENWKSAVTGKFYIDNYYMRNYNSMPTLCTHYEAVLASSTSQVGFGKIGLFATATQGQSSARLVIGDNNYTSVDDFKAYLSQQYQAGTPIIVLYPLIEQTTETVSGQPLDIPAWNSTIEITQASIDDLELEATYEQEA